MGRVVDVRLDAVRSLVGVHSHGVEAQLVENRGRIPLGRRSDVAALGVGDRYQVVGNRGERRLQQRIAVGPHRFIEGQVRLVRADEVGRRLDDAPHEALETVAIL